MDMWTEHLRKVLHNIAQTALIPDLVFLFSDEDAVQQYEQAIINEDFHQYVSSQRPFSIVPVMLDILKGRVIDRELQHDPFLVTTALFASRLIHRPQTSDVFDLV
jgi:hypothetical protein